MCVKEGGARGEVERVCACGCVCGCVDVVGEYVFSWVFFHTHTQVQSYYFDLKLVGMLTMCIALTLSLFVQVYIYTQIRTYTSIHT